MPDDIQMVDPYARRDERMKLAQDYLLQELPGFRSYVEFVQDPFGVNIHVKAPIPFAMQMNQSMIPLVTDVNGDVLKHGVDELIRTTRDKAIQMLGLDARIEERVDEGTRKEIARKKAEIERVAYERGLEAGVNLTLRAKKDADEALDRIEGDSQ